jgi:hypothetical protein
MREQRTTTCNCNTSISNTSICVQLSICNASICNAQRASTPNASTQQSLFHLQTQVQYVGLQRISPTRRSANANTARRSATNLSNTLICNYLQRSHSDAHHAKLVGNNRSNTSCNNQSVEHKAPTATTATHTHEQYVTTRRSVAISYHTQATSGRRLLSATGQFGQIGAQHIYLQLRLQRRSCKVGLTHRAKSVCNRICRPIHLRHI